MIDQFLEGDKVFIENDYKQNREHYLSLSGSQSPKTLLIGCADSRVAPERITNANAAEIFFT
ncbi:carbonic anhydrase [Methanocalculus sp.]|uniref:carbonic anhydrase n=1 Tax=Methanocalculus sp. TaxID=2004547 RepID=UPI00351CC297